MTEPAAETPHSPKADPAAPMGAVFNALRRSVDGAVKKAVEQAKTDRDIWFQATVTSVNAGPPKSLSVTIGPSTVNGIRYADSISAPAIGNVVWCRATGPDIVAVYRLA